MKYFIAIFVTAVLVFLGATVYYKGLPSFSTPNGVSVTSQEVMPTSTPSPTSSAQATMSATQTADENISIVSAVQAALIAEHGPDAKSLNITISKVEGNYAEGDASAQGGGGMWYAAEVNGVWKLVWDGNGSIMCSSLTPYPDFPKDMISECWDASNNAVVR
jgi:hypothetical protein